MTPDASQTFTHGCTNSQADGHQVRLNVIVKIYLKKFISSRARFNYILFTIDANENRLQVKLVHFKY